MTSPTMDLIGGVINANAAQEQGQAQQNMYNYKAQVARINQQVNKQNAAWALQAGETQAQERGLHARQAIASQKTVQSASGFDVNSGSNQRVREDMSSVSAFEQNTLRWDAAKTAYGYEIKAVSDEAESNLDVMAGQQAKEAGDIGEITSYLNAGSRVADKWSQAMTLGMGK